LISPNISAKKIIGLFEGRRFYRKNIADKIKRRGYYFITLTTKLLQLVILTIIFTPVFNQNLYRIYYL